MNLLKPKISDYLIIGTVVALMLFLPYLFVISSASSLPQYQDAKSWVESEAVITHASTEYRQLGRGGAWHPKIRYRYQYNGSLSKQNELTFRATTAFTPRTCHRDTSPLDTPSAKSFQCLSIHPIPKPVPCIGASPLGCSLISAA